MLLVVTEIFFDLFYRTTISFSELGGEQNALTAPLDGDEVFNDHNESLLLKLLTMRGASAIISDNKPETHYRVILFLIPVVGYHDKRGMSRRKFLPAFEQVLIFFLQTKILHSNGRRIFCRENFKPRR